MWGDPFCMTAAWTLPAVANAWVLTYTLSSSNYSCTMCSFHHEVIDKVSWIKLVCIIYVIWNCWRLARKSVAVDQDSARSYYIIPWLAFSTVFTIDVHIWWVELYCCIQNSSQPEFCRASGKIFLELCINNLFNGYSVLFEASSGIFRVTIFIQTTTVSDQTQILLIVCCCSIREVHLHTPCNGVTSDVLYSGYFQFVFKALTLKVDGSLGWLPCVLLQFLWFWTLSVPFHIDELVWSCFFF